MDRQVIVIDAADGPEPSAEWWAEHRRRMDRAAEAHRLEAAARREQLDALAGEERRRGESFRALMGELAAEAEARGRRLRRDLAALAPAGERYYWQDGEEVADAAE